MSKKQRIIELAMPAAFILMAAYVAVQSLSMGSEGIFPMMSAGVLFLCAVYLLFQTLKKQQAVVNLQGVNLKMVGITLLALLVYVFLLKKSVMSLIRFFSARLLSAHWDTGSMA